MGTVESGAPTRQWRRGDELPEVVRATCLFDSAGWLRQWSELTIETYGAVEYVIDDADHALPLYLVEHSPFWLGYERQTGVYPLCHGNLAFAGSPYSMYTKRGAVPVPLIEGGFSVGMDWIEQGKADLLVVPNLTAEGAASWTDTVGAPLGKILLDRTYHVDLGADFPAHMRLLSDRLRRDVGRRRRRAGERGLVIRMLDAGMGPALLERALELTVGTSDHHDWPALYDLSTLAGLLEVPGAVTAVAEVGDQLLGVFFGFRHDEEVVFLTGGVDYQGLSEYSTYVALMYHCTEWAYQQRFKRIEWGRDNYRFKERHGLAATELWGLVYGPPERADLAEKFVHMHSFLARYMQDAR